MVGIVLGEEAEAKISAIPLSNNTVQRRISEMSEEIKAQVINEIKSAGLYSLQLDESTDVAFCSQLLVFARYIHSGEFKEEFLFCTSLQTTTKAADV